MPLEEIQVLTPSKHCCKLICHGKTNVSKNLLARWHHGFYQGHFNICVTKRSFQHHSHAQCAPVGGRVLVTPPTPLRAPCRFCTAAALMPQTVPISRSPFVLHRLNRWVEGAPSDDGVGALCHMLVLVPTMSQC